MTHNPLISAVDAALPPKCTRDPEQRFGAANCGCPECQDEWQGELDRIQERGRRECDRRVLILQSEGFDAHVGPFNMPMIFADGPEDMKRVSERLK